MLRASRCSHNIQSRLFRWQLVFRKYFYHGTKIYPKGLNKMQWENVTRVERQSYATLTYQLEKKTFRNPQADILSRHVTFKSQNIN